MSAKDVLIGAREAIMTRGWCQGNYSDSIGAVCLLGALRCGSGGHPLAPVVTQGFQDAVSRILFKIDTDIDRWNDKKSRTKEEVLQLLDETIASINDG